MNIRQRYVVHTNFKISFAWEWPVFSQFFSSPINFGRWTTTSIHYRIRTIGKISSGVNESKNAAGLISLVLSLTYCLIFKLLSIDHFHAKIIRNIPPYSIAQVCDNSPTYHWPTTEQMFAQVKTVMLVVVGHRVVLFISRVQK